MTKEPPPPPATTHGGPSYLWVGLKLVIALALLVSGGWQFRGETAAEEELQLPQQGETTHRRLSEASSYPYVAPFLAELQARKKLFAEAEVIKYWFEYSGPLQKYYYRYSQSRHKADYFEGRDDSGVVSARYETEKGGTEEFRQAFDVYQPEDGRQRRFLENCLAMGSAARPDRSKGSVWDIFYGDSAAGLEDRCRVLFTLNTVGAGRGTILLWETTPPPLHVQEPTPFVSEQESAVPHLQRNLQEIDAMCATGLVAARVQLLVCEPIDARWVEWLDSQLVHCGGKAWPMDQLDPNIVKLEDRPSPLQAVVASTAADAGQCHDLKSGYMEKRAQSLILSAPKSDETAGKNGKLKNPSLVSSDDFDLYVSLKWSTMVTTRALSSFLQASADLSAASLASPSTDPMPESPFLVPSFVRVSYLSEENSKVAKWRMHGDFFHPATNDMDQDSFDVAWIPGSLAISDVKPLCQSTGQFKLPSGNGCGQWWIYFTELQMPTSPDVYANEHVPPLVPGGSNAVWMLTERQREELVKAAQCHQKSDTTSCPKAPQAVMPLGDLESFLLNFMPNTGLGKKHVSGRRPGYTHKEEHDEQRHKVHKSKQFDGEEEMETALFDYTIYPAALLRKDATIKAARARDGVLSTASSSDSSAVGPHVVKSSYYDVTITKPRPPVLGWCQAAARRGLCSLYADYFRTSSDDRCLEACGLRKDFSPVDAVSA